MILKVYTNAPLQAIRIKYFELFFSILDARGDSYTTDRE